MALHDHQPAKTTTRATCHLLLVIVAVIILAFVAVLVLRPNPSGNAPQNSNPNSAVPTHSAK